MPEIAQLLRSPVHRYEGHAADGPVPVERSELVDVAEVRAGLGIVGDRYFNRPAHRDAAITLCAAEHLPAGADLVQLRRNVLVRGLDVDALVGRVVTLTQAGGAPLRLRLVRPARPCAWLDAVVGPGTRRALAGRAGVRCVPLDDGVLRLGPVEVEVDGDAEVEVGVGAAGAPRAAGRA